MGDGDVGLKLEIGESALVTAILAATLVYTFSRMLVADAVKKLRGE